MTRVKLKADGAILLGANVSCDGFSYDHPIRVQTHIHHDHMVDFDTSKANQTIVLSHETRALLFALFNADLPYRTNIRAIGYGEEFTINGDTVQIIPSHHMLGSVQVCVTCADGYRIGYSSDFFWPVEQVIEVDELIVDSTYGDPSGIRAYRQSQVDEKLVALVCARLRAGTSCAIIGYNGRLHHSLHLLGDLARCPILVSPKAFPLVEVYRTNGYSIPHVFSSDSSEGRRILKEKELCLAFASFPERRHLPWVDRFAKLQLSAYLSNAHEPVTDYGNGDCCISFTDHADFQGTLAYIEATKARVVWTDPRTGNAAALAEAAQMHLGIDARVAIRDKSLAWG
jgi:putative mRNA 3-end processing factor